MKENRRALLSPNINAEHPEMTNGKTRGQGYGWEKKLRTSDSVLLPSTIRKVHKPQTCRALSKGSTSRPVLIATNSGNSGSLERKVPRKLQIISKGNAAPSPSDLPQCAMTERDAELLSKIADIDEEMNNLVTCPAAPDIAVDTPVPALEMLQSSSEKVSKWLEASEDTAWIRSVIDGNVGSAVEERAVNGNLLDLDAGSTSGAEKAEPIQDCRDTKDTEAVAKSVTNDRKEAIEEASEEHPRSTRFVQQKKVLLPLTAIMALSVIFMLVLLEVITLSPKAHDEPPPT